MKYISVNIAKPYLTAGISKDVTQVEGRLEHQRILAVSTRLNADSVQTPPSRLPIRY